MIKIGLAASALMALSVPFSANATSTTEGVRQAVCVTVEVLNPDGSGESTTRCTINSDGSR